MQTLSRSIIVAGAGPAGMMAAIRAAQSGGNVILLEKNPVPGHKLLLSGKGRCNLTNACGLDPFLTHFNNGQFLRNAFAKLFNKELMDFFRLRGLKLKIERQERVFPENDRSVSVRDVLVRELAGLKVEVLFKSAVKEVLVSGGRVSGVKLSDGRVFRCDRLILATGGASYKFTGSAGDGIAIAAALGHKTVPLRPGLVPLTAKKEFPFPQGLTLKNIRLVFQSDRAEFRSDIGEMVFTHFGVSGPLVFTASGNVSDWLAAKQKVFMFIDLKPGLTQDQIGQRLTRDLKDGARKSVRTAARGLLPSRMADILISRANIRPDLKCNQVTAAQRQSIADLLKKFPMEITGTLNIEEAMVTRGGVSLKDIDPRTMGSRVIGGLYFAGEMIDIDADTGGFNLQAAFSTGYLAGESAASKT